MYQIAVILMQGTGGAVIEKLIDTTLLLVVSFCLLVQMVTHFEIALTKSELSAGVLKKRKWVVPGQ